MFPVRLVFSPWLDTWTRSPGILHPVDIFLFSYSCTFASLRLAAVVLFLCSVVWLCYGHLLTA